MRRLLFVFFFSFFASACFFTESPLFYTQEMQSNTVGEPFWLDFTIGWNGAKPNIESFNVAPQEFLQVISSENVFEDASRLVKRFNLKTSKAGSFNVVATAACNGNTVTSSQQVTIQTPGSNCPYVYNPVCGTDDKTYTNECFASAAGVQISYKGQCTFPITITPPPQPTSNTIVVTAYPIYPTATALPIPTIEAITATTQPRTVTNTVPVAVIVQASATRQEVTTNSATQTTGVVIAQAGNAIAVPSNSSPRKLNEVIPIEIIERETVRVEEGSQAEGKERAVPPAAGIKAPFSESKPAEQPEKMPEVNNIISAGKNETPTITPTPIVTPTKNIKANPTIQPRKEEKGLIEEIVNFFSSLFSWK